jgi:two-component system chemotaxis response regulator CheB
MADRPTPIVVVAANVDDDCVKLPINALRAGALSIIEKPSGGTSEALAAFAERLCTQLSIMSQVHVITQRNGTTRQRKAVQSTPRSHRMHNTPIEMIGIVASTGGPNALLELLRALGPVSVPILIVQHMTPSFANAFAEWLSDVSGIGRGRVASGVQPEPGKIYVAPADRHLTVRHRHLLLHEGPLVSLQRPSGTVLLESLAVDVGSAAIGVVLTGMGSDGAQGLNAVRSAGGYTIAEHESTAVVYGMPGTAVAMGAACETLPLSQIAPRIRQLVQSQ